MVSQDGRIVRSEGISVTTLNDTGRGWTPPSCCIIMRVITTHGLPGSDSDAIHALGLKKRSEKKRPARRKAANMSAV